MKLFAIYIGGKTKTSLIELHDMRFAIGEKIEDTYDDLRVSWWGTPRSLHMDCWGELTSADGYNIHLRPEPSNAAEKLYFVNLGGYDPNEFTELHKNVFVVATSPMKAKYRALAMVKTWQGKHKDALTIVEQVFCINDIAQQKSLFIHLEKTDRVKPFIFKYGFMKLPPKTTRGENTTQQSFAL